MSIETALTALQGDITAARAAVTAKGGTVTSGGGSSQLAGDIATIPSGGRWTRPAEWPDYSQIDLTGQEVLYITTRYEDELSGFSLSFSGGSVQVERGNIINGEFIAEDVYVVASGAVRVYLDPTWGEYQVFRFTPVVSLTGVVTDYLYGGTLAAIVEVYGRLPGWTDIQVTGYRIEHIELYDAAARLAFLCSGCVSLRRFDGLNTWDFSNTTSLLRAFGQTLLEELDLSGADLSNCADTSLSGFWPPTATLRKLNLSGVKLPIGVKTFSLFSYKLEELDVTNLDVSHVTSFNRCLYGVKCNNIIGLNTWDVSGCLNFEVMFGGNIRSITPSGTIDLRGWQVNPEATGLGTVLENTLAEEIYLTGIDAGANFGTISAYGLITTAFPLREYRAAKIYTSCNFSPCNMLSHDSLISIIDNLVSTTTAQKLTLGTTNRGKLTASEIAVATEKGWTVA